LKVVKTEIPGEIKTTDANRNAKNQPVCVKANWAELDNRIDLGIPKGKVEVPNGE